ncbi:MAG: coenzyme F420-0:L-glutamate ligase [Thermoproteota archaeon]|nr:MAG: coenzyme F420-0:L-glutamate ligase [Candidatus Korarchaeota archaeon]RLG56260.1 MAG: coenzyme F420-0:L-glutamate ligase [Candidatus Korarchaeota archaeon]
MLRIELIGVEGIPDVKEGDDIAKIIVQKLSEMGVSLENGDIIVVTQKIVSKAEGRIVNLGAVEPSQFAVEIARRYEKDARVIELALRESKRIVRMDKRVLITETKHGFVCANSGVDLSNVGGGELASLLPEDPDASADRIRRRIREITGVDVGVVITDTWGRPWRRGQVNFAIGISGVKALLDYRGSLDMYGRELRATVIAVADEIAAAAELVMGKSRRVPVALVRGCKHLIGEGRGRELVRPEEEDLFR